jgi:hypothetical protein
MNFIAYAALFLFTSPCWAQLAVTELERLSYRAEIREFIELADGDVVLRVDAPIDAESGPPTWWNAVYLLAHDGRLKQRVELPAGLYEKMVPYRDGFACQRREHVDAQSAQIVAFNPATTRKPQVIFESDHDYHTMYLAGAPDGRDLYVLQAGMEGLRLTRIDDQARAVWQQPVEPVDLNSFAATDDGVALVQFDLNARGRVLRTLDRNGKLKWETPRLKYFLYEVMYAQAGLLAMPGGNHAMEPRMVLFDARSGEEIADVAVPRSRLVTGTRQGLLMAGLMSGQPFVGMLDRDGQLAWVRRYVADERISDIQQGLMTRQQRLLLVSRERSGSSLQPVTSIVSMDSTATALQDARGQCLDPRWSRQLELEARLQKAGIWVARQQGATMRTAGSPCPGQSESEIIAFTEAIAEALPGDIKATNRQELYVSLSSPGKPLRLESYGADRTGYPSAGVRLTFSAPPERAKEFAQLATGPVQAHLNRMNAFYREFVNLTRFPYGVSSGPSNHIAQTFSDLESAARTVNEAIARIPPSKLADIRGTGPRGWVSILLRVDGFGSGTDDLQPTSVADQTFVRIVEENRRNAEQGSIMIRD